MSIIGTLVVTVVMTCAVLGALASVKDDEKGLGREFLEGLHAIGYIFVPVAGVMAAGPFLARWIDAVLGPAFTALGADPALAATSIIAVDMGGYQLAQRLTTSTEGLVMAMFTGTMAGATIVFSIPVGLSLLDRGDHKYLALGVMAGLLAIPAGVFLSSALAMVMHPAARTVTGERGPALALDLPLILHNLLPLALFVLALALGLRYFPERMIRGFMIFGRLMGIGIRLVIAACIVEYFTTIFYGKGLFTWMVGAWEFDPVIADYDQIGEKLKHGGTLIQEDIIRALEVAGYIGLMLAGAFPMVHLLKKYLAGPMEVVGRRFGLSAVGAAGILAASANILAMFRLVKDMPAKDKVLNIAFAVCAAFLFGDHLAFTANFQPDLLLPVMLGKAGGGVIAMLLAHWLCVPKALEMELEASLPAPSVDQRT